MSIALLERENTVSELVKNALEPDVWINHLILIPETTIDKLAA